MRANHRATVPDRFVGTVMYRKDIAQNSIYQMLIQAPKMRQSGSRLGRVKRNASACRFFRMRRISDRAMNLWASARPVGRLEHVSRRPC